MQTEESVAVKIEKKKGEQTRVFLREKGLIRSDLKIKRTNEHLLLPITHFSDEVSNFDLVTSYFEKLKKSPSDYKDLLSLPAILKKNLPTSFDIIGDILLLKLPDSLFSYASDIGDALLKTHSHVKTVCVINPVQGELRKRSVRVVAGEQKTKTEHKEYGLSFSVDVEKTYFSPRLASERMRVTKLIRKDTCIFDMFCGVAPFSVMIARYAHPLHILAIDKNPEAVRLAKKNIVKNNVENKITLFQEDAKNTRNVLEKQNMIPDHIIMNLPFSAIEFFPLAVKYVSHKGIIHYYDIISEKFFDKRIGELKDIANNYDTSLVQTRLHKIKTYAPHEFYIGIDITVSKNQ